jgi:TolB-like protein
LRPVAITGHAPTTGVERVSSSVFISYRRSDEPQARRLYELLREQGVEAWYDAHMSAGEEWRTAITEALQAASVFVLLYSSRAAASDEIVKELAIATLEKKTIVPIRLENITPTGAFLYELASRNWIDAFDDDEKGLSEAAGKVARLTRSASTIPAPTATAPVPAPVTGVAIAVLPFVNLSSDPEQDYFSDGLAEELINQLSRIKRLRVAGRSSSFAFKGRAVDPRTVGETLGVSHLLEGSVRKSGQRLRIGAQLISCGDGFQLWSERFDRELTDVFEVQDEIAMAVAEALSITLDVKDLPRAPGGTDNAEAYDLMLRAKALTRRGLTAGDAVLAAALLRQALKLDPHFAVAWSALANALIGNMAWSATDRAAVRREIDEAVERCTSLAPDLWTAHEMRANQLELAYDWVGAERANARSMALAPPTMREPVVSRAHQLAIVGRVGEAIPFAREAARVEPLAPNTLQGLLDLVGGSDEAEAEYQRTLRLPISQPLNHYWAVARSMMLRNHGQVRERLVLCAEHFGGVSFFGAALEMFDEPTRFVAWLSKNIEDGPGLDSLGINKNLFLGYLAAYVEAPELVLRAWRAMSRDLLGVQILRIWHPLFAEVRKLPGFKDLVSDFNLPTYWRTTGEWGEFARPVGADDFEILR